MNDAWNDPYHHFNGRLIGMVTATFRKLYWDVGGLFGVGIDVVSASIF